MIGESSERTLWTCDTPETPARTDTETTDDTPNVLRMERNPRYHGSAFSTIVSCEHAVAADNFEQIGAPMEGPGRFLWPTDINERGNKGQPVANGRRRGRQLLTARGTHT